MTENLKTELGALFDVEGFESWGWTPLSKPLTLEVYEAWIESGHHGDMDYLEDHLPLKRSPRSLRPQVKSAFVVTEPYLPHPWPRGEGAPLVQAGVARYARGWDYHLELKKKLSLLCETLKASFPEHEFYPFTDSAPIMERDLAYRASLGWFGKNTCLIDRERGSFFFIAEILTTMEFLGDSKPLERDFCGTCTRCIDACPTGALEPQKLDARKCISYWTIESSEVPPIDLRKNFQGLIFGCDICQSVCPWNLKLHGEVVLKESGPREQSLEDMRWILTSSGKRLQRDLRGTPLARAAGLKLKRNALIAVANLGLWELTSAVEAYLNHEKLGELATWVLLELRTLGEVNFE